MKKTGSVSAKRREVTATPPIAALVVAMAVLFGTLAGPCHAAMIGLDDVHDSGILLSSFYHTFRSVITDLGHTIVPLTSFESSDLTGLDALIVVNPADGDGHTYSASEQAAIHAAVGSEAVFISDATMWSDSDGLLNRDIAAGDNQQFLVNVVNDITGKPGLGLLAMADTWTDYNIVNFNELVAPFGISYASTPTDLGGHDVTSFVAHPVTSGLTQLGVDFHFPITTSNPSIDLTTNGGSDNIVSALPEPATAAIMLAACGLLVTARRRR